MAPQAPISVIGATKAAHRSSKAAKPRNRQVNGCEVISPLRAEPQPHIKDQVVTINSVFCLPFPTTLRGLWSKSIADTVMDTLLKIFIVTVLALAFIGWLADRRAAAQKPNVTPGLSFLPGDIKYESPNGNVRVYFPIVTSIVLSVVLTLILRLFS
jgi:hypothetical protein